VYKYTDGFGSVFGHGMCTVKILFHASGQVANKLCLQIITVIDVAYHILSMQPC